MRVFRISKAEYISTALLGEGSSRAPGRWNSKGKRLGYVASSTSLAMLEVLVHVMDLSNVPAGLHLLAYDIPDDAIHDLAEPEWPDGWDRLPYSETVRAIGDAFVDQGTHLAMRVPSAIVQGEYNLLINPAHARFGEIVLVAKGPLAMDERLFGRHKGSE